MMRHRSKKTARRERASSDSRKKLLDVGRCEVCRRTRDLCCHEIARGPSRQRSRETRFAVLAVCHYCHTARIHGYPEWSEARQLAVLKRSRPHEFDLEAYNALKGYGPNRITEADVEKYEQRN